MDISNLPIELLEEIFILLDYKDLIRCTYVCYQWREIINSNKVWSVQCSKERLLGKLYLETSQSLISNPVKAYRDPTYAPRTRLTQPCHWRLHFSRYKFLERNWREGNFSMVRCKANATHYQDGHIISLHSTGLIVWGVHNLSNPMSYIWLETSIDINCVRMKDDLIFYTQEDLLTCLQQSGSDYYNKLYEITLGNESRHLNDCRSTMELRLNLKITDKFMVIQDTMSACTLYIYDYKTGNLLRKVDLHANTGRPCPMITCLEAHDERVYVAYSLNQKHYILVYNYKLDKIDVKVETPLQTSELIVSKNFFAAKVTDASPLTLMDKSCELHVWSVHTGITVELLLTNRSFPVILTFDNKLIYSDNFKIYVRGLLNSEQDIEFHTESRLSGMEYIWGNLLVLNLGKSLQLWDIESGQKLHTYLRESIEGMWVDDRHIVVSLNARPWMPKQSYIIGFW